MANKQTTASPASGSQPGSRFQAARPLAVLAAITVAAAWVRLHALGARCFWLDEGITAGYMRLGWYGTTRLLWRREGNMSLYFILLGGWLQFGDSEAWYRALSVLFAVATVPVIYAIGARLFGTRAGLLAALLMALNAYHVRYSQEARSYSLAVFLVTLATWFLVRAVQDGRRRDWNWYVACGALAAYAHFYAVLAIAAHWVSLRLSREDASAEARPKREFKRAMKLMGLWTLPIWVFLITTGVGVLSWLRRPGWSELYSFLTHYAGNAGAPLMLLYLTCILLALGAAVRSRNFRGDSLATWKYGLAFCWFFVPVAIVLAVTVAKPVFLARYLIIALPGLALMAASGMESVRRNWLILPLAAAIAWLGIGGIRSYYEKDFDIVRADYRGAAAHVLANALPGDALLFHQANARYAYDYYAGRFAGAKARPVIVAPGHGDRPVWRDFMSRVTPQVLETATHDYSRVWVLLSNNTGPQGEDPLPGQIRSALGQRLRLVEERGFEGIRLCLYASSSGILYGIRHF